MAVRRLLLLASFVALLASCGGGGETAEPATGPDGAAGSAPTSAQASTSQSDSASGVPTGAAPAATNTAVSAPLPSPSSAPTPAPALSTGAVALSADTSCGQSGFRADLLAQINQARQTARICGTQAMPAVAPLGWNDALFSAAARHARDMADNNYFSHTSLDGRTLGQRVTAEGYNWRTVGENIAAGPGSVSAVMQGWLDSPGHCRNIMGSVFTEVAVSCVARSGSRYGRYWVMVLGTR